MQNTASRLWSLFPDTKTVLAVKATVWCAKVFEPPPADLHATLQSTASADRPVYPNIIVRALDDAGRGQRDFLGPDIDTGFRIAKYALRQRMVVSADLAYLLYRDRADYGGIEASLKIVSFEQLKGVWGNRHYPIFWYELDWDSIARTFAYDEHYQHDVVRRLQKAGPLAGLGEIVKIFEDINHINSAEDLWAFVRSLNEVDADEIAEAPGAALSGAKEVHCVAVCFREDGHALIARRPTGKRIHPGAWEFGCGQLEPFETFADCLRRAYREDFRVDLDIPDNPVPVSTYVIRQERSARSGIIFVAGVRNSSELRAQKHTEVQWVDPRNPSIDAGDACVPDLIDTLKLAADLWDEVERGRTPAAARVLSAPATRDPTASVSDGRHP
jgi:8-oxo-dGTP pyrophosphatase MutT (NUDIX family)